MTAEPVEAETLPVVYRVLGIERVVGASRLLALALVELEISGVVLRLQGVQVRRLSDGIGVEAPQFRHARTGKWLPALVLPAELSRALADEVLAELERTADPRVAR